MIEKCKALTANQNTDLPEPASPDDVNEVNARKAGCIRKSQQTTTASQTATA